MKKIWMLPSYKPETPSSQMRVYKIAPLLQCETIIIPHNLPIDQKFQILKQVKNDDYIFVQKWRTEFNQAEYISQIKGIKIFDMDDISEDQCVIDMINISDFLFLANHYLMDWAKKFNKSTRLVPTGVEMPTNLSPYNQWSRPNIIIAKYGVDKYIPAIAKIDWKKIDNIAIRILGTINTKKEEAQALIGPFCKTYNLVPFSQFWKTYGKMLSTATLGIMPLNRNAQGKSAFSVLTMMSAGLPIIASPYGECDYIIKDNINGFLAEKPDDWLYYSEKIIYDKKLRQKMSVEAIKTIVDKYTIEKVAKLFEL